MFSLSIAMGSIQWRLMFKTEEAAKIVYDQLSSPVVENKLKLEDDFGQTANINTGYISGILLEDMDQSKLANVAIMLFNAEVQLLAQKQAQTNPAFRAANSGPAIINPVSPRFQA